jgi:hypothetical protein
MQDGNKKNTSVSNLLNFQQAKIAQLVERLALDPEARVRNPEEANFLNK